MTFANCYEDGTRAEAYATLEFKNTYHLRIATSLPSSAEHVRGRKSVDFGCGTGRSTRFLRQLGFEVTGVDIAEDMIRKARELDPSGDYRLVPGDDLGALRGNGTYDLVLAAFTIRQHRGRDKKVRILRDLGRLLNREGKLVLDRLQTGDLHPRVGVVFDKRLSREPGGEVGRQSAHHCDRSRRSAPGRGHLWTDEAYREVFEEAHLRLQQKYEPLGREDEPYRWVSEAQIAPWAVYVLGVA